MASTAAARGFEQELVLVLAAENRFGTQSGFAGDVHELDAQGKGSGQLVPREHSQSAAERSDKGPAAHGPFYPWGVLYLRMKSCVSFLNPSTPWMPART